MAFIPEEILEGTELIFLIMFFLQGLLDDRLDLPMFTLSLPFSLVVIDKFLVNLLH
jgi:hypothetical protein